eukprot:2708959-Pleurochrysis_carterae.AAC.2
MKQVRVRLRKGRVRLLRLAVRGDGGCPVAKLAVDVANVVLNAGLVGALNVKCLAIGAQGLAVLAEKLVRAS